MDPELKAQFEKFDSRFDQLDSRLETTNSQMGSQFQDVYSRLDRIQTFMMEHLVTRAELDERLSNLPTKEDFQNLVTTVDGYARNVKEVGEEIVVLGEKANRLEAWAKQAGTKLGVEYNP